MGDQKVEQAIGRIEQALARIERAAARAPAPSIGGDTVLTDKHEALRARVRDALGQIDGLLRTAERG